MDPPELLAPLALEDSPSLDTLSKILHGNADEVKSQLDYEKKLRRRRRLANDGNTKMDPELTVVYNIKIVIVKMNFMSLFSIRIRRF